MRDDEDDVAELGRWRTGPSFGRAHEHYASLGSTNDRAAAWAKEGAPHGALVTADAQTAGRGRRGRSWESPAGENLYASVVVRPGAVREDFAAVGLAVAVGLREGLPEAAGVQLKWPNDLLARGQKLGGILCESRWLRGGGRPAPELVVGFGINVHGRAFTGALSETATSLALLGCAIGRGRLLADVLVALEGVLDRFLAHGFEGIRARYERHSLVLGREIDLEDPRNPEERRRVRAQAFDRDGALLVKPLDGGSVERVETADVWLVPP
jgi:BirA family biotin operon repressor/biotin-[acetyl-CoA-carboxylase] ligase